MSNTLTINELASLECPREEDKDHSSLRGEESRTSRDGQQGKLAYDMSPILYTILMIIVFVIGI